MREFETTIPTEMEQGKKAFDSVMSSMDRGLRTFVMNGKLSFKAFAQSIISDMFSIFLRAQSMQMFKSLGSLFGPSYVTGGEGASSWVSGADLPSGLAAGGDINGPRLVGELGPELFIPKGAGTIIPNNQMASAMGGPQITYNGPYIANMQAIDTQSATQFLARNKLSVYAANQSASRSLPTSR
jgi:phage-related minor tail protein